MKKWILIISLIFFVGCKADDGVTVSVPSRLPDIVTDSGIFIYIETDDPAHIVWEPHVVPIETQNEELKQDVEARWLEAQSCIGMNSEDPPAMIIVEDVQVWLRQRGVNTSGDGGHARYEENLVIIKDEADSPRIVWRHEFIHIILHQNGVPDFLNTDHQPEYLWGCQDSESYNN